MGGSGNRRLSTPNQSSSLLLTSNSSISSSGGGGASSRLREDLSGGGGDKQQRNLHNVKLCNIVNILITYHRYAYYGKYSQLRRRLIPFNHDRSEVISSG